MPGKKGSGADQGVSAKSFGAGLNLGFPHPVVRQLETPGHVAIFPATPARGEAMVSETLNTYRAGPDERGHFGIYGGQYVAETLMPLILEVGKAWRAAKADPTFQSELDYYLEHYVGRPSPLYFAERLTAHLGGAKVYFKRDELNHTGAHKVNNVLGQALLGATDGQAPDHRRDRRRSARSRHRHGLCAVRHPVRHLHGRGRHRAAGAERLPDASARRRGDSGKVGIADPQGRDERGDARLGLQRRQRPTT